MGGGGGGGSIFLSVPVSTCLASCYSIFERIKLLALNRWGGGGGGRFTASEKRWVFN